MVVSAGVLFFALSAAAQPQHPVGVQTLRERFDTPLVGYIYRLEPPDLNGVASGFTPLTLTYAEGTAVTAMMWPDASGFCARRWELDGAPQPGGIAFTVSGPHSIVLRYGTCCATDWNQDEVVDSTDISAFLAAWLASLTGGDLTGDMNGDGVVNSTDVSRFIMVWSVEVGGIVCEY